MRKFPAIFFNNLFFPATNLHKNGLSSEISGEMMFLGGREM